MIDVNFVRDLEIALHGLNKLDEVYTIYYDETNNIRRLHVRADGLNVREPKCFVIGGIAHHGPARELDIQRLRAALRIQKTANEIKLKHVATGELSDLLAAAKLEVFFRWLIDAGLFIHYFALDPLYWSVVDVIDSILTEYGNNSLLMANWELKNDLYAILRNDPSGTVDLFQRYSYPNVGHERRPAFVAELLDLLEYRRNILPHFNYMMLKGVLEIAKNLNSLPYLEDETPNVLIDGFGMFFIHRICLFKNCEHILDVEEVVQSYISGQTLTDGERPLATFRFAVSNDEPGIQISDVVTGVLGKLFSFIQESELSDLVEWRESLSHQQERNLGLLRQLLDRSLEENSAFAHYVMSLEDRQRAAFLLEC
ncbi:hypothetical protein J2R96_001440 [Bradyrhizobium elkanii]|nr:hypothetical protein [Bradyrhizobium elkanii]